VKIPEFGFFLTIHSLWNTRAPLVLYFYREVVLNAILLTFGMLDGSNVGLLMMGWMAETGGSNSDID
jgi:hypothetical protein